MCNCIFPTRMDDLIHNIHELNKNIWTWVTMLNCEGYLMFWPATAPLSSTSTVIHQVSELWTLGLFSFSSPGSYGSSAAAGACWTGLSEESAEDRAGACFNNACVLEATSGQRPFLKRRFKDTPRPTHVQEPIKNRKSGWTKQHASAEGLRSPEPVINKQGTFYMHL